MNQLPEDFELDPNGWMRKIYQSSLRMITYAATAVFVGLLLALAWFMARIAWAAVVLVHRSLSNGGM